MTVQVNRFGPFTQADGAQAITLPVQQTNFFYHSVALLHVTTATASAANPVESAPGAGTFVLEGQRFKSNVWEPFGRNDGQISAVSVGGWDIARVALRALRVTPTGYDSDKSYFVYVNGVN